VTVTAPSPTFRVRIAGQASAADTTTTNWISVDTGSSDVTLGGPTALYDVWSERPIESDEPGPPSGEPGFLGTSPMSGLYAAWALAGSAPRRRSRDAPAPTDIGQPLRGRALTDAILRGEFDDGLAPPPAPGDEIRRWEESRPTALRVPAPLRRESLGVAALRARGRPPITRDDPAWGVPPEA
jgi:hypothetical protein